ncbi:MAG: hypothetical protein DRJ47_01450 [Thermoprotei archaeon]|nr:MAG: hypothetical protein DRJ47_01450 [Thermoprotei archaeon]
MHVALTGLHSFTRDLVELIESLKALNIIPPEKLYMYADALPPHYTMVRCPGRKPITYNQGTVWRCIEYAREIIKWVKKTISQEES